MKRRVVILAGLGIFTSAFSQSDISGRLSILRELVEAIGAAGDAISKLTDGIGHLVSTANSGYSYVAAARDRQRLIDISRRTADLIVSQNAIVVKGLDDYLNLKNPSNEDWILVTTQIGITLNKVKELLNDVKTERSDFVLESAYLDLMETLSSRNALLKRLMAMDVPSTAEERMLLVDANRKYKVLIEQAKKAVEALNLYVKKQK